MLLRLILVLRLLLLVLRGMLSLLICVVLISSFVMPRIRLILLLRCHRRLLLNRGRRRMLLYGSSSLSFS